MYSNDINTPRQNNNMILNCPLAHAPLQFDVPSTSPILFKLPFLFDVGIKYMPLLFIFFNILEILVVVTLFVLLILYGTRSLGFIFYFKRCYIFA